MTKLKLVNTAKGYDFYIGKDGKSTIYNIVPAGSKAPTGGYPNPTAIAKIKRVDTSLFKESTNNKQPLKEQLIRIGGIKHLLTEKKIPLKKIKDYPPDEKHGDFVEQDKKLFELLVKHKFDGFLDPDSYELHLHHQGVSVDLEIGSENVYISFPNRLYIKDKSTGLVKALRDFLGTVSNLGGD